MFSGLIWLFIVIAIFIKIFKSADPQIPSNIWAKPTFKRPKNKITNEEVGFFIFASSLGENNDN